MSNIKYKELTADDGNLQAGDELWGASYQGRIRHEWLPISNWPWHHWKFSELVAGQRQ